MTGPLVTWKDDYNVGHAVIDRDHKHLVDLFNQLAMAVEEKAGEDRLGDIIYELVDYVEGHFAREESLFENADYGDAKEHCTMHRVFEKRIHNIVAQFHSDPEHLDLTAVVMFLRDWLVNHIMRMDQDIVDCINAERRAQAGAQQ